MFTYDQLNRLATGTASTWSQTFSYDAWGNMSATATGTAMPVNLAFNANNHITTAPFAYDAAGNETADAVGTYVFNAEGELKTAGGVTYTYDGDGRRAQKSNGRIYWYGVDGSVLDETDATGSMTNGAFNEYIYFAGRRLARRDSAGDVFYYGEDVLGSSVSMVEVAAGQTTAVVCSDSDYYPYGGEKVVTNTCPQNYKWTGKERDAETGNDDFDARYYSSVYGRFLSADWSAVPAAVPYANLTNPQTLNLYAIVRDNPESFADLDGHVATLGTIESGDGGYGIDQHPDTAAANAAQEQRTQQSQPQTQNVPPEVKAAIADAVNASNSRTADDKKGGFHEESLKYGKDPSGNIAISPSVPGPYAPPRTNPHTDFTPANPKIDEKLVTVDGFVHIHPKGGGDRAFVQGPSQADRDFAKLSPVKNIVVGAANKKVYTFNGSGDIGKPVKLKDFMKEPQ